MDWNRNAGGRKKVPPFESDLVAKRGASAASVTGPPILSCRAEAPACRFLAAAVSIAPRSVRSFAPPGRNQHLAIARGLDVIGVGWSTPAALLLRMSGLNLHRTGLVGDQRRARPLIIHALCQQMPAEHSELAATATAAV
jgi:hypothetical protein